MNYTILNFNDLTGTITVQVEGYPIFALTLTPDLDGNVPTGEALEKFIMDRLPVETEIEITELQINNAADIHALVEYTPAVEDVSTTKFKQILPPELHTFMQKTSEQLPVEVIL